MNASQVVTALEYERQLLREFHNLSKEQLLLLEALCIDVNQLSDQRADLLLELAAIEATLGTWIDQVGSNSSVSHEVLSQLQLINDDIVQLAGHVIDLDEQTYRHVIKSHAEANTRSVSMSS